MAVGQGSEPTRKRFVARAAKIFEELATRSSRTSAAQEAGASTVLDRSWVARLDTTADYAPSNWVLCQCSLTRGQRHQYVL